MFNELPSGLSLWTHQNHAIQFLIAHLRKSADPCLVRMPTGTGKTGVIACLSLLSSTGRTLVLTPWTNLRDQMIGALKAGFWQNLNVAAPAGKIVDLIPSSAKATLKDDCVKVIVCTFSTLTDLKRTNEALYYELASFVDTIVVDECHYEPAIEWGRAVKSMAKPTVLLTATPYRNDLKLFRIKATTDSVFHFTHAQAEAEAIIRTLDFASLGSSQDVPVLCRAFARAWAAAKKDNRLASRHPRAIVCCATAADIRSAVATLRATGLKVVGIHEQFEGSSDADFVKNVPALDHPAEIWVHQNKLTEGLDDHRFCALAFVCNVNNDRKLVQQIGRVLRKKPSDVGDVPAMVFSPVDFRLKERWLAYRDFEASATVHDSEHFRKVVEGILESQPPVEYFDGRFRRRFRTDVLSDNPQVAIAPSVLIRRVQPGFTLKAYIEDTTDSLNLTDAIILGTPNAPCQQSAQFALWVYASVANSRLLEDTSLYEVKLEAHCAVLAGDFLLVSDTSGTYPEALLETLTVGLGATDLARLLDRSYRVTNVAISSAIPFDTVLRASELRGHDLNSIPSSLTDRVQICRAARGASAAGRRYVGLHRGRVREELSERARRQHSLSAFKAWAMTIGNSLSNTSADHPVLQRYMQTCTPPDAPVPVAISVDLALPGVAVTKPDGTDLLICSSSVDINPKAGTAGLFECTFKFLVGSDPTTSVEVELTIEYQKSRGRFWFKARAGSVHVHERDDGRSRKRSFADYLNQNQETLLIGLVGGEMVYQGRNFYLIDYEHAERALFGQITTPAIAACSNEKGTTEELAQAKVEGGKATSFIEGSLFKRIAEGALPMNFVPDLIICDDLGSECADFMLANFDERELAFVHAKAGGGAGISASAFHDVVAQAMKNLVYLARNNEVPEGIASWTKDARWNNTNIPRLYKRPTKCPTGADLWQKLRDEIINTANAQLHVVLATTGCCNLPMLQAAVKDPSKRTSETAQLLHLLDGLIGYARQLGVRVTIFDVPFKAPPKKPAKKKAPARKAAARP